MKRCGVQEGGGVKSKYQFVLKRRSHCPHCLSPINPEMRAAEQEVVRAADAITKAVAATPGIDKSGLAAEGFFWRDIKAFVRVNARTLWCFGWEPGE